MLLLVLHPAMPAMATLRSPELACSRGDASKDVGDGPEVTLLLTDDDDDEDVATLVSIGRMCEYGRTNGAPPIGTTDSLLLIVCVCERRWMRCWEGKWGDAVLL